MNSSDHAPGAHGSGHDAHDSASLMSIARAAELIRTGRLSPVELVSACLERVATLDDEIHAFITVLPEAALAAAHAAEQEIRRGRWRGPMHGIPYGHKDNICTAGIRTTAHSNQLRDWVPSTDAAVHQALSASGGILLGKLTLWEYAGGTPTPQSAFPAARHPWNREYSPGGSSSGSAAAVAAGMCMGATGTDTGGSIRHPAAVCGLVGMKPTYGLVSCEGVLPLSLSQDHVGPLARCVHDNAIMLQAMLGPLAAHEIFGGDFSREIGKPVAGLKVGVPRSFLERAALEDATRKAFEEALAALRALGMQIVDVSLPSLGRAAQANKDLTMAEAHTAYRLKLVESPDKFDLPFRQRLEEGGRLHHDRVDAAKSVAASLRAEYAALFDAGISIVASPAREDVTDSMEDLFQRRNKTSGDATRMYNLTGLPALVQPMGSGREGLPLGIQFAAPPHNEALLYRVGAAYEDAAQWSSRWFPGL